jgi:formylglycine-generating enzyme required for sulfatase activity
MSFRSLYPSSIRLLQALAIAAAGFSVTYAQTVPGPHAPPPATEKAPAGEPSAQVDAELWTAIKDGDRAKVFEEYIRQYPDGRNSAQAASRLADLRKTDKSSAGGAPAAASGSVAGNDPETALWKVVFQGDNSGGYEVFLKYYPKGKYARLAASRLKITQENARWKAESVEQGAWQAAESTRTADGYAAYLASYPQGRYASLALAQRDKLGANAAVTEESRFWQTAEKGGVSQIDAYLARYPQGAHALAANSRRVQLKKEEADMIPGKTVKDCPDCPAMVVIPAGSFQMGENDAKPMHTVTIGRHFSMAKTEVTQSQWRAVMGTNPSRLARCDDCPVEGISWNDAKLYVDKLSRMTGKIYRLPSEAEWEYACRAGGRQEYCGSDTADSVAWHGALLGSGNSDGRTHPAGQKQANAFGLHDMSGNVSEWVEDCYHARYADGPSDGSAWTTSEGGRTAVQGTDVNAKTKGKDPAAKLKAKDPAAKAAAEEASAREKEECKSRVLRGGSWLSSPQHTRAAHRLSIAPNSSSSSYGFRPVWSLR